VQSSSLFVALTRLAKEVDAEDDDTSVPGELLSQAKTKSFICPWDRLFTEGVEVDDNGIVYLFGLFEETGVSLTQMEAEPELTDSTKRRSQQKQTVAS
jgi:hypothetical protein